MTTSKTYISSQGNGRHLEETNGKRRRSPRYKLRYTANTQPEMSTIGVKERKEEGCQDDGDRRQEKSDHGGRRQTSQ
ncbi:hypothetical protein JB92DRAFT_2923880 [Gautieria morchelliformis]|nr:hypothetical protein JB92DRAFT_2923880 [Gautieria morchelliformis]